MGAGELGLNLFHEVPETIRIIRRAFRDGGFRAKLLGVDIPHTPHFFVYYPMRSFVEDIPVEGSPVGELAVSLASADLAMPHFRYRTGDLIRIVPFGRLAEVLERHAPDLVPPGLRLPCVAVFGRRGGLAIGGQTVTVEMAKEALFADPELARATTGFFRLSPGHAGSLSLEVQIREGQAASGDLRDRAGGGPGAYLPGLDCAVRLYAFSGLPLSDHLRTKACLPCIAPLDAVSEFFSSPGVVRGGLCIVIEITASKYLWHKGCIRVGQQAGV